MSNIAIKKIDKLLLRSFVTTFILLLALVLFILIIQGFFIVFSNIVGKNLGFNVYVKLLFYLGLRVFPDAFPTAMLITSLLVFGNFAESLELTALRSGGLSLQRIFRLPFIFVLSLSGALLYFQDYIHPTTNHKIFALVNDVFNKKSALFIQQGIVCNNIPGYSIHVEKKLDNTEYMHGITVYDYTKKYGTTAITIAETGKLYTTKDQEYLVMELANGHNYVEALPTQPSGNNKAHQLFYRNHFARQTIKVSLQALKIGHTNAKFANYPETRTHSQLKQMIQERQNKVAQEDDYNHTLLLKRAKRYNSSLPMIDALHNGSLESGQWQVDAPEEMPNNVTDFMLFRHQLVDGHTAAGNKENDPLYDYRSQYIVRDALWRIEQIQQNLMEQLQNRLTIQKELNLALFEQNHRLAIGDALYHYVFISGSTGMYY